MIVFRINVNKKIADALSSAQDWIVHKIDGYDFWTREATNGLTFRFACGGASGMHYEVWRRDDGEGHMNRLELGFDWRHFGLGWGKEYFPWGGGLTKVRFGFLVIGYDDMNYDPDAKGYDDYEDKQEYLDDNPGCAAVVDSSGEETIVYERKNK